MNDLRELECWVLQEVASTSFLYAHLYALDHFISTAYTVLFAVDWWVFEPHDGQRIANSAAQQNIIDEARKAGVGSGLNADEAKLAAQAKWSEEKGFSLFVLIASWLVKACCRSYVLSLDGELIRSLDWSGLLPCLPVFFCHAPSQRHLPPASS